MIFRVFGNWKMHKNPQEARDFVRRLRADIRPEEENSFCLFPPALTAFAVNEALLSSKISWGGQNCYFENAGAFTGENSPQVLKEMGAGYCLVGHSERRQVFFEPEDVMAKKVKALQDLGLSPVLCVGETLDNRKWGRTAEVILRQLKSGLALADFSKEILVAYEPVWAIGTGEVAHPEQVAEVHDQIRKVLEELAGAARASEIPLLYGGSVKASNASGLAVLKEVNGFLVGGASLNPEEFLNIYRQSASL
jgi:triosephosphate isomerase